MLLFELMQVGVNLAKFSEEKTKKLIFGIVSNINFPEIKVKFVTGIDLLKDYPKGIITRDQHNEFFKGRYSPLTPL